jgi:hypothetical protein
VTILAFEVLFFAGFLYSFAPSPKAPTFGALNPYNLCLGYNSEFQYTPASSFSLNSLPAN